MASRGNQFQGRIPHQTEIAAVGVGRDLARIFGVAINVPEPASHVFVQCGLEKSTVDPLVARTVYRTGGGQQRNAAATAEQDGLPSRVDVGVIETKKLAGGRHEQRQAIEVGPSSMVSIVNRRSCAQPRSPSHMANS